MPCLKRMPNLSLGAFAEHNSDIGNSNFRDRNNMLWDDSKISLLFPCAKLISSFPAETLFMRALLSGLDSDDSDGEPQHIAKVNSTAARTVDTASDDGKHNYI
jgi:hypothetical protein